MRAFRAIGLVLFGAVLASGVMVMRDTVHAQNLPQSARIRMTPTEWTSDGKPFRFVVDTKAHRCYLAALSPRDTSIQAMVEAPGACD